jgi:hypothetical protein
VSFFVTIGAKTRKKLAAVENYEQLNYGTKFVTKNWENENNPAPLQLEG